MRLAAWSLQVDDKPSTMSSMRCLNSAKCRSTRSASSPFSSFRIRSIRLKFGKQVARHNCQINALCLIQLRDLLCHIFALLISGVAEDKACRSYTQRQSSVPRFRQVFRSIWSEAREISLALSIVSLDSVPCGTLPRDLPFSCHGLHSKPGNVHCARD